MCRLLLIESPAPIDPNPFLVRFRALCKSSREYQGHGWGCAWLNSDGEFELDHDIRPIWEDARNDRPPTHLFLVHARSAFRDEGIEIDNNMPFSDGSSVFLFNGELRGVRIKAEGRIGAEKIYNMIRRLDHGDLGVATRRGVGVIDKRTRYIRAMNFFLAEPADVHVCSWFGEDPAYFQLHRTEIDKVRVICSAPLPGYDTRWDTIPNQTIESLPVRGATKS